MKRRIKRIIETLTNTYIFRTLPRGINPYEDIKHQLPQFRASIFFDVGANIGQTAYEFLRYFPGVQIYCFEPVKSTFNVLQKGLKGHKNVHCYNFALGALKGKGNMVLQGSSDRFYLSSVSESISQYNKEETEEIEIELLDDFCIRNDVKHISYLKIDTEGYDLEVLKGAKRMLNESRIDIVEVEAGMNPKNTKHVPFEELKKYFEERKYYLFGIYWQAREWPTREPHLRRTNPVFISERVIEANKQ